ncbi:helix-turn-helix domain-containing protein [Sinorhizobium meliloti]|nr:helix-turn-helix domain-containing protein [Sinorhizobium meliloti]
MDTSQFAAIIAGIESTGMTKSEIARETGLSRMTVWRYSVGEFSKPSYDTVIRLQALAERRAVTDMLRK